MGLRKAASRAEPLLVDLSELGDSTRRVRQQAEAAGPSGSRPGSARGPNAS